MVADTKAYRTGPLREDEVERYRKDWFLLAGKVMSDSTIEKLRAVMDRLAGVPVPGGSPAGARWTKPPPRTDPWCSPPRSSWAKDCPSIPRPAMC
jgi:hypothetical protein